jgi:hypothetical protein
MNDVLLNQMTDQLWIRAGEALVSKETWQSPNAKKKYYVATLSESRISIHRDGDVEPDSLAHIRREKVREVLSKVFDAGAFPREKCPSYAFANSIAHFLSEYVRIAGKNLMPVIETSVPQSAEMGLSAKNASVSFVATREEVHLDDSYFEPSSHDDARHRVIREIVQRRGQQQFRLALFKTYNATCVVTGCQIAEVLEAAHIVPYRGDHTNVTDNGLLLRSDIHTLFDLNLLGIDPSTMTVILSPALGLCEYDIYRNTTIAIPASIHGPTLRECLAIRWQNFNNSRVSH